MPGTELCSQLGVNSGSPVLLLASLRLCVDVVVSSVSASDSSLNTDAGLWDSYEGGTDLVSQFICMFMCIIICFVYCVVPILGEGVGGGGGGGGID